MVKTKSINKVLIAMLAIMVLLASMLTMVGCKEDEFEPVKLTRIEAQAYYNNAILKFLAATNIYVEMIKDNGVYNSSTIITAEGFYTEYDESEEWTLLENNNWTNYVHYQFLGHDRYDAVVESRDYTSGQEYCIDMMLTIPSEGFVSGYQMSKDKVEIKYVEGSTDSGLMVTKILTIENGFITSLNETMWTNESGPNGEVKEFVSNFKYNSNNWAMPDLPDVDWQFGG